MSTVRLFEAGAVYLPKAGRQLPIEPYRIAALMIGDVRAPTWRDPDPRSADFFAAKGVLTALLEAVRAPWSVEATQLPFLHPGRAAKVLVAGIEVGWLGEVHPLVAQHWDLADTVAAFELDFDPIAEHAVDAPTYEDVTSFPEVREDLAVIVGEQTSAAQVLATVRAAGAPLLTHAEVFDVYRDVERIGEGNVSLAIRLAYRAGDRTLTDEEVTAKRAEIIGALESELHGRIRAS